MGIDVSLVGPVVALFDLSGLSGAQVFGASPPVDENKNNNNIPFGPFSPE